MKKLSLNFLNRLETKILQGVPEASAPVSSTIATATLVAATLSIVTIFILQMFNVDKSAANIVLGVTFGLAFLFSAYICYQATKPIPATGGKIALYAYALVLFGICSLFFIWLMVWVVIIIVGLLVLWMILKATTSSSGNKKSIRVHYSDGTTEDMVEDGKGICGETYYKGDKGGTHVE